MDYRLLDGSTQAPPEVEEEVEESRSSRSLGIQPAEADPSRGPRGRSRCCIPQRLVIVPEDQKWLAVWDVWIVLVLFVTTYYEPYAVAVLPDDPHWAFGLTQVIDFTFTVDMLLVFVMAYSEPLESRVDNSLWVKDPWRIARRYCGVPLSDGAKAGWFWIDLLTVLPGWLSLVLPPETLAGSRPLVLLRLLRLVRITKLVRLQHLLIKWHQRLGFPFYVVDFGRFMLATTMAIHWIACLWIVVEGRLSNGKLSYRTDQESWLSALIAAKGDSCTPSVEEAPHCIYLISLYWATMTLTGVGYGDVTAQNPLEYFVCSVCIFAMGYIWAYVVGQMVGLLSSLDPQWQGCKQSMDTVQALMASRGLPADLQVRVRRYMHVAQLTTAQRIQRRQLQDNVSESLQREVAMCGGLMEKFSKAVFWARELQQDALLDLVRALEPASFGPGEVMMLPHTLLFLRRGLAAVKGRIIKRGDIWGQSDILLVTEALVESAFPRTLSYVDILSLSRQKLLGVCEAFPHADRRLRRAQIRCAVFRAFVKTAKSRSAKLRSSVNTVSSMAGVSAAATSFVNPGHNKKHVLSVKNKDETTLSDLRYMVTQLTEKHDALEASLKAVLALRSQSHESSPRRGGEAPSDQAKAWPDSSRSISIKALIGVGGRGRR